MTLFDPIRNFISGLDRKELIKWSSVYVGICFVLIIILLIWHVLTLQEIKSRFVQLNKSRMAAQEILTKFQAVEQQKNTIDEALKKDKNFNIQKFFQELGTKMPAAAQVTPKFSRQKLANGYTQESLAISFSQIDTLQLCQILQDIENEPLVYVEFVDINRMSHAKKINVTMSIATLRAEE